MVLYTVSFQLFGFAQKAHWLISCEKYKSLPTCWQVRKLFLQAHSEQSIKDFWSWYKRPNVTKKQALKNWSTRVCSSGCTTEWADKTLYLGNSFNLTLYWKDKGNKAWTVVTAKLWFSFPERETLLSGCEQHRHFLSSFKTCFGSANDSLCVLVNATFSETRRLNMNSQKLFHLSFGDLSP